MIDLRPFFYLLFNSLHYETVGQKFCSLCIIKYFKQPFFKVKKDLFQSFFHDFFVKTKEFSLL